MVLHINIKKVENHSGPLNLSDVPSSKDILLMVLKVICRLLLVAGQWIDMFYLCYRYSQRKQAFTDHSMASSQIHNLRRK